MTHPMETGPKGPDRQPIKATLSGARELVTRVVRGTSNAMKAAIEWANAVPKRLQALGLTNELYAEIERDFREELQSKVDERKEALLRGAAEYGSREPSRRHPVDNAVIGVVGENVGRRSLLFSALVEADSYQFRSQCAIDALEAVMQAHGVTHPEIIAYLRNHLTPLPGGADWPVGAPR